jgi:MYXO-CTERM domain-containing protein
MTRHASTRKRLATASLVLGVLGALFAPEIADAHFVLQAPQAWMSQDSLGLPEKLGPCGDEDDGTDAATPTGTVTTVQEGSKITVTINEVIFHPGHYRIAVAKDRKDLPAEPIVTPADTPCGSAPIQSPPVFPVLADGVFIHTTAFTTPQSIEVTLPTGFTCPHCTLQVIEFMGEHPLNNPGGCFYHHCADLAIESSSDAGDASPPPTDSGKDSGGTKGGPDAAEGHDGSTVSPPGASPPSTGTPSSSGCGCLVGQTGSGAAGLAFLGVLGVAVAFVRRRRAVKRGR